MSSPRSARRGRYAQASPAGPEFAEWINVNTFLQPLSGGSPQLLASNVEPFDWSHDGRFLAGEIWNNVVVAMDPSNGQTRTVVQDTYWNADPVGWSPVGHTVAVVVEQTASRHT